MRKILFLLLVTVNAFGQTIDYNKIILPNHIQSPDFAERLVQLAWQNNPGNEILSHDKKIAEYSVKRNNADWWDIIQLQGNVNEFTKDRLDNPRDVDPDDNARAGFYPLYNFRASVPLGIFTRTTFNKRIAREQVAITQSTIEARKLEIRNVVMKTYNDYLLKEKIYKIQTQIFSDVENGHKLVEQKFKNGEVTFEQFSNSQANYNRSSIVLLTAETDYKNTKLDLEKLIGVALEDVR
jgi:outer membrane protein TolC